MLYSDFAALLRDVCQTVNPTGFYVNGKRLDGSQSTANDPFPQIHVYSARTTKDIAGGNDNTAVLMGFWYKDDSDSSPEQREVIIGKADVLCNAFLSEMISRGQLMQGVIEEPDYWTMAGIASGIGLSFTLVSKMDICE